MAQVTFYAYMGLPEDATPDRIREQYKMLVLKFHPDRNPGDKEAEEVCKTLNMIYDALKDPAKRAQYDAKLAQARQPRPSHVRIVIRGGFGGFNATTTNSATSGTADGWTFDFQ